jgi:WD40 repeat protein
MVQRLFLLILLFFGTLGISYSQIYRPKQLWSELKTPHFKIIYRSGSDSLARASARILESAYPLSSRFTGGELKNFPVILNDYNDRSNGFVSPILFRSEVEVPPIKGKALNPRTGGWLENVLPHELVHAQHMNVLPAPGIAWFVGLFSPDYGRGLNTFAHSGFFEGIAVYHESTYGNQGGRGNQSAFQIQYDTNWLREGSGRRWSLGTSLSPAGATHPLGRHYIGGYMFSDWLIQTYGEQTVKDIIRFHSRWPILGFGVSAWAKTGDGPLKMQNRFSVWYDSTRVKTNPPDDLNFKTISIPYQGALVRRPLWINDDELLFHGSFYNQTAGFFRYIVDDDKLKKEIKTSTIEDYIYTYDLNSSSLIYSVYETHPFHSNRYLSVLKEYDLETGKERTIEGTQRSYAPSLIGETLDMLATYKETSVWLRLEEGRRDTVLTIHPNQIIQVMARPKSNPFEYAVIANKNGLQGIWLVKKGEELRILDSEPDIRFHNQSVVDIHWSPDGSTLYLSADGEGAVRLYEYQVSDDRLWFVDLGKRLIWEPAMSPNSKQIAFVYLMGQDYKIGYTDIERLTKSELDKDVWRADLSWWNEHQRLGDGLLDISDTWNSKRHRDGFAWLRPRLVGPFYSEATSLKTEGFGLALQSADFLQRHNYEASVSTSNEQFWYDLSYRNTQFYPGFNLSIRREPLSGTLTRGNIVEPTLIEDKSVRLGIPFNWTFKENVENTLLYLEPEISFRSLRAIDSKGSPQTEFKSIKTLRTYSALGYKLERALRDVQPRRGALVFADTRMDLDTYMAEKAKTLRFGVDNYVPFLASKNNSLLIRAQYQTQSGPVKLSNSNLHRFQFLNIPYQDESTLLNLQLRYAFPLRYPDKGGLLIPWYLERSYVVLFSNTLSPLDPQNGRDFFAQHRTSFGAELRFVTGFPNFRIDLGFGIGHEILRNETTFFIQ